MKTVSVLTNGQWQGKVKVEKSGIKEKDWQLVEERTSVDDFNVSGSVSIADDEMVKITVVLKKGEFNAMLNVK